MALPEEVVKYFANHRYTPDMNISYKEKGIILYALTLNGDKIKRAYVIVYDVQGKTVSAVTPNHAATPEDTIDKFVMGLNGKNFESDALREIVIELVEKSVNPH